MACVQASTHQSPRDRKRLRVAHAAQNILALTVLGMRFFPSNTGPAAPETDAALATFYATGIPSVLWGFVLFVVFIALTEAVIRRRGT